MFKKSLSLCALILFSIQTIVAQVDFNQIYVRADSLSTKNFDACITLCNEMLSAESIEPKWKGAFLGVRGKASYFKGNFEDASNDFMEAVAVLESFNESYNLGLVLIDQARLYRKLKMFDQAHRVYDRAATIFQDLNHPNHLATVWNEWGVVYELQKDYNTAIEYYKKSLAVKLSLNDTVGVAYSNGFLSTVYLLKEDYDLAEQHGKMSIELFKQIKDHFAIALQSSDIALVYEKKKDLNQAIYYLNYSDSIAAAMSYLDLLSENYRKLSNLYQQLGKQDQALEFHQKYAGLRDSLFTVNAQKNIAELYVQYESAEKDKQLLIQENKNNIQKFIIIITIVILILTISIFIFIYRTKQLKEAQLKKEAALQRELLLLEKQNAIQNDRLRISQDLHDNIGSNLTFILSSLEDTNSISPEQLEVQSLVKDTIAELRRTVWLINKPSVTIEEWLIKLKEYYKRTKRVEINSNILNNDLMLASTQATVLFRIIQEAVQNAIKHANAELIRVEIQTDANNINIGISDNGIGFNLDDCEKGFGIGNMQQNAKTLNGTISFDTASGKGTHINLVIPI